MILKNIYISLGKLIEDVLDMGKNEASLFFFFMFLRLLKSSLVFWFLVKYSLECSL